MGRHYLLDTQQTQLPVVVEIEIWNAEPNRKLVVTFVSTDLLKQCVVRFCKFFTSILLQPRS